MFILLLLFNLVVSEKIFFIGRNEVVYVDRKLQWNEAAFFCKSHYDGDLLSLENPEFGGSLIPQLKNVTKNVWVGGRLINNGWRWKKSGNLLGGQKFPPLPNNTKLHQCLSLDLSGGFPPTFTSFACATPKEFLCEASKIQDATVVQGFSMKNHNYTIFEGHSTWYEAVDLCNKHNSRLVTLNTKLTKEMSYVLSSYTYLDITTVWVGSFKDHNKWIWVSTGDLLSHQEKTPPGDCLSFDTKTQKYQPFNCTKTLSVVCENLTSGDLHQTFTHQNTEYHLYQKRVPWEMAHKICLSKDTILANIPNVSVANEVARNMEKSALSVVWIGAKSVNKSGVFGYAWYDTRSVLVVHKDTKGYPPWLRNYAQPTSEICVGLLDKHRVGRFVIDFCDQAHGFLCQTPLNKSTRGCLKLHAQDRDLHLYQKPQTWYGAGEACKISGCRMFFLENPSDEFVLNNHTLPTKKIWLNGTYESTQWKVPTIPNFVGLPKATTTVTTCLAATFTNDSTTLNTQSCNKRLPFVCNCNPLGEQQVYFQQHQYTVVGKRLTWFEAYGVCKARGQNLAFTYDINEAKFLAGLSLERGDLWLGGKKQGKTWTWTSTNEHLPNRMNKKNLYPPWYTKQTTLPYACLSVGFTNHKETFKASACNEQKGFICEKPSPIKNNHKNLQPRVSIVDDKQYTFHPVANTWKNASKECEDNNEFLVTIPNMDTAQKIASLSYGHPEIWVGGKRKNLKWIWSATGENVQIFENGQIQWENENTLDFSENKGALYLSLNRMNPDIPIFVEKSDGEKLGYVCEKAYNPEGDDYLVETVKIGGKELVLYEKRRNYTDAHEFCISKNSVLVEATSKETLKALETHGKKFHGVWLGATLSLPNLKFMWNTLQREVTEEIYSTDGFVTNPKWRKPRQIPLNEYTYSDEDDFVEYDSNEYEDDDGGTPKVFYYDSEVYDIKRSNHHKRDTDTKKGQIKVEVKYENGTHRNKRHIKVSVINSANSERNGKHGTFGGAGSSKTNFVTFWKLKTKNTTKKGEEFKEKLVKCLKMDEMGRLIGLSCSSKQSFVCEKNPQPT